ncbi:MAG TPA: tRNA lysidine(34) synthetase TilS [Longimicrobiales bacterium]
MAANLGARFLRFVRSKQLVSAGDRVLVAVSGGIDSMVLLHLFRNTAHDLGITVVAAHFDHAMRDTSADDAQFVADVCDRWQVPLLVQRTSRSLRNEAEARSARYEFLTDAMMQLAATRMATAHHADDQIETVLFRLLRGAGLRGLSGIPLRRGSIIRPLLRFHKKDLAAYATHHAVAFRDDETNASDRFARNRIRRTLIPALQSIRPQSMPDLLAVARRAARVERAWRDRIREALKHVATGRRDDVSELARGILLEYDAETQGRLLRAELKRLNFVPDRAATQRMLSFIAGAESGSSHSVGDGIRIERAYDVIRITREEPAHADRTVRIPACAAGAELAEIGGRSWRIAWTTSPAKTDDAARFDCRVLHFPLEIRSWRAGDRIRLSYGTKKLKKLFSEARIPVHERARVPVLVDADGRICWVVGVARSVDAPAVQDAPAITIMVSHAENS